MPLAVRLGSYVLGAFVASIIYIPAIAYRLSLKSTALVWSPLLWILEPLKKAGNVRHFAEGIVIFTKNRIARVYSVVVFLLFATKVSMWIAWIQISPEWKMLLISPVADRFVAPTNILTWHLAAVANAVITWWMYFRAEEFLHDLRSGQPVNNNYASIFFKFTSIARNSLTVYVLFCVAYILISFSSSLHLPPLHFILVPW